MRRVEGYDNDSLFLLLDDDLFVVEQEDESRVD